MAQTISGALRARCGTVAVVGAGGKKTTLYALAGRDADERARQVVVTATVRIPIFDPHVDRVVRTDDPVTAAASTDDWPIGLVPGRDREDRYRGYDPATVDDLSAAGVADLLLVKADGARNREFKAPGDREPQLPRSADTVVPIASVRAVGKPLADEYVHRPERVEVITGREPGDRIRPDDVAAVIASDRGGLKDAPDDADVVALLNKVDTPELRETATEIAGGILDRTPAISRVVLARMVADEPLVDVIE